MSNNFLQTHKVDIEFAIHRRKDGGVSRRVQESDSLLEKPGEELVRTWVSGGGGRHMSSLNLLRACPQDVVPHLNTPLPLPTADSLPWLISFARSCT